MTTTPRQRKQPRDRIAKTGIDTNVDRDADKAGSVYGAEKPVGRVPLVRGIIA